PGPPHRSGRRCRPYSRASWRHPPPRRRRSRRRGASGLWVRWAWGRLWHFRPVASADVALISSAFQTEAVPGVSSALLLETDVPRSLAEVGLGPIADTAKPLDHFVVAVWLTIQGARRARPSSS